MILPLQNALGPLGHRPFGFPFVPAGPFGGHATLGDVAHYYKMDEESGVRVDEVGSKDLTDNNTVLYTASGKIDNAASYVGGNSEYLSLSQSFESYGSWSFAFWVYGTPPMYAVLQHNPAFKAYIDANVGGRLLWTIYDNVAGSSAAFTNGIGTSEGWFFVVVGYDSSSKKAFSSVNGSASVEGAALTNGPKAGTVFYVGGKNTSIGYDDLIKDAFAWYDRVLIAGEVADFYNDGSGLAY